MAEINYTKEYYLEILRSKRLYNKNKDLIVNSLKVDVNQTDEQAKQKMQRPSLIFEQQNLIHRNKNCSLKAKCFIQNTKREIAKNLSLACYDILSKKEEDGIYKLSCILTIKSIMDLGQQVVLVAISQNLLSLIKTTVIQYCDTEPVGIHYISDKPNEKEQTIGEAIVGRMLECVFTWACWHYKNSNGTKTRFFLTFEQCLKDGVEFPEEEKFIYFTREEIFRFQGKAGFQAVLYLEDLVDLQFQINETKIFLEKQFELSETQVDQDKIQDCLTYYEDLHTDSEQKQLEHFFPEDKAVFESEMWYIEKVLPKFKSYKSKKITFQEFKLSVQGVLAQHQEHKKKVLAAPTSKSTIQSNAPTGRSQDPKSQEQQQQEQQKQQQEQQKQQQEQLKQQQQQQEQLKQQQEQQKQQQKQQQQKQQESQQKQPAIDNAQSKNSVDGADSKQSSRPPATSNSNSQRNNPNQAVQEKDKKNDGGQRLTSYTENAGDGLDKQAIVELKSELLRYQKTVKELEQKIKERENTILNVDARIEDKEMIIKQINHQKKQDEDKIESLESQLYEMRQQVNSQKNQSNQKNNEELQRLQTKVNELAEERDKLKQKITNVQNQLDESEKERAFLQSKKNASDLEVGQLNFRIEQLENQINQQEKELRFSEGKVYEALQEKENEYLVEKQVLKQENDEIREYVEELEQRLQQIENDQQQKQQHMNSSNKNFEETQQMLLKENEDNKILIAQLQQMVAEEEEKANNLQREHTQLARENNNLKEDLNTARHSQSKSAQDEYNFQILDNQIQNLTQRNKELEYQLEQAEFNAAAAPSNMSNNDYQDRSSYQQRVQDYDTKINKLQQEANSIPVLQFKINELETLINIQQKTDRPVTKDQEKSYSQIKKVLAETIEKSKQLDNQLNSYIQHKQAVQQQQLQQQQQQQLQQEQQQQYHSALAQRSSSAQNFRNTAPQNFYSGNSESQRNEFDRSVSQQQFKKDPNQINQIQFDKDLELKHYQTQPNFYARNQDSTKILLSQLNIMKSSRLHGMASTNGFQNNKANHNKMFDSIPSDNNYALPEKYEEEESQMNQSVASLNDIRDLRQIDKVGADLIFPFRNPKMYYSNKAKLKASKGKLVYYDDQIFNYIRYPKDTIYKFKRSCLKWKFSIFENEDLQIGQISSFEVINNQYIVIIGIYITNKTDHDITNLSINYIHSNKIQMQKDHSVVQTSLTTKKQLKQSLTIFFTQIPYEVIIADVEYRCHGFNQKFQVPIPCLITKYLEIQELENGNQFKNLWLEISKFNLIRSEDCQVNKSIAKSPQDFHNYFPTFINLNPEKASQYHLGLNDYILGGQIYLRQPNVTFLLKIYLKPNNMISFKIASGSEIEDRSVVEFFMQNLMYIYTIQ